jgi:hypothetical protein
MNGSIITQGLGTALLLTQGFATSVHGSGGVAQGGSPQVVPCTVVGSDTFTGADGTALESHTPNVGGSWVANATNGSSQAILDSASRVRNGSTALVAYTISAVPSSADQSVQADVVFLSRNIQAYDADVTARFSTTSLTGYSAGYDSHSQLWHLSRWNDGSQTALQTASAVLGAGNSYTANLVVHGSSVSLYVNGTLTIGPYTDVSPITTTGNVGLLFRITGTTADIDTTGAHLDNFVGESAVPSTDVFAQYFPATSGGLTQGGSAGWAALYESAATGGAALGGGQIIVADVVCSTSGGMPSSGQSGCAMPSVKMASGGLVQGGWAFGLDVMTEQISGGLSQGGDAAASLASLAQVGGGPSQGGTALFAHAMVAEAIGGMSPGGCGVIGQARNLVGVLITQGLGTSQIVTQGYSVWLPNFYMAVSSGGIGLGGSGAVSAAYDFEASGGAVLGGSMVAVPLLYHVYMNRGQGDPINYATPVATVAGLTWTSGVLTFPGDYKLGVRAYDPLSCLEEQNVDAVVEVVLDADGNDVTRVPPPPLGLRAVPLQGGRVRVEWTLNCTNLSRQPLGFHVYLAPSSVPDYSKAVATVAWSDQRMGYFVADLGNLTNGSTYAIGVRAFNAFGEEANTIVLSIKADATPPSLVDSLEAVATNQED